MAKSKERSELEDLRARNKKLEKENRQLRKEIGRFEKRKHLYEENLEDIMSEEDTKNSIEFENNIVKRKCPKCGKELKITDLGSRLLLQCENCSYRKTEK
jgi:predicted RNA-binding Zn-ribbon protein involved in translation (DUF1610 family)